MHTFISDTLKGLQIMSPVSCISITLAGEQNSHHALSIAHESNVLDLMLMFLLPVVLLS